VEEDRVVCIRFGHAHDSDCMVMDETLYNVSEMVQNFAVIYLGKSLVSLVVMKSKLME
jgi:DIM1 family U5 snRNP protein